MRIALPAGLLAAALAGLVVLTGAPAGADPLGGRQPSLPGLPLPTLPLPSLPPLPLPTTHAPPPPTHPHTTPPAPPPILPGLPPVPGLPGLPGLPGQPGPGQPPGPSAPPAAQVPAGSTAAAAAQDADPGGMLTPGAAGTIIANNPAADLFPQPPVDAVTTAQSRLVARLEEAQHRVQYLQNVLTRTNADLASAQSRLDATGTLITLLTSSTAPALPSGAIDDPEDQALALSAAIASGEADLARTESVVRTLQQQVNSGVHTTLASSRALPTATTTYGGGRLRRPVPGRVTSSFGNRFDPYYHVWQLHAGVDLGAPSGTAIVAAASGRVTRASWSGGYGNYTCIDHGQFDGQRLSTCYGHQSLILVRPGQQVHAGQVIGRVGATGAATGPHLHFEVRLGGRPVDPMPWI
jgi:murein DD-endopeptidase MepM/ murein hydrolase activator NlpD